MTDSPDRWPVRRYGWIVARFLLFSGAIFLLWPWLSPGYVALLGRLMPPLLGLLGFNATLVEQSARTLQFDVIHGTSRGLVTPLGDLRPILLNMATLVGLFSGAFLPPRWRRLRALLIAALLLVLYQSASGAFLVIVSLPEFADHGGLATLGDILFASRAFVPILLWLALDVGARYRLNAMLSRVPNAAPGTVTRSAPPG